jgi:hypothetical protein
MLLALMKAPCGLALVCAIAVLAGAADAARPTQAAFDVTLSATVTKDWNAAVESTEDGCTVVRRSIGHRTVTLRSSRPTRIVVTLRSGKASFAPSVLRFVTAKVAQSGENSTRKEPCGSGTVHERCRPVSRRSSGDRSASSGAGGTPSPSVPRPCREHGHVVRTNRRQCVRSGPLYATREGGWRRPPWRAASARRLSRARLSPPTSKERRRGRSSSESTGH